MAKVYLSNKLSYVVMLKLSESIIPLILQRLIIAQVGSSGAKKGEVLSSLRLRLEIAAARAAVDAIIIGGVTFFSSMIMLGSSDIIMNIKLSLFSAIMLGGLTLFTTLKSQMSKK